MSMKKSSNGAPIPAGPRCGRPGCSPSSTRSCRSACRARCRPPGCRPLRVGAGVYHPVVRRSWLGQGHGGGNSSVGDRHHGRRDRAHRQDHVRDGKLAGAALVPGQPVAPVRHPRAVLLLGLIWVYVLGTSLASAFGDLLSVSSWLTISFYILTALAMTVFYRRSIFASPRNVLTIGVLPLASVAFLGWVLVRSFQLATAAQKWSMVAVIAVMASSCCCSHDL